MPWTQETAWPPGNPGTMPLYRPAPSCLYFTSSALLPSRTMTADEIKALLKLEPHPVEGGSFRRTYTAGGERRVCPAACARRARQSTTCSSRIPSRKCTSSTPTRSSTSISATRWRCCSSIPDGGSAVFTLGPDLAGGPARPAPRSGRRVARHAAHRRRQSGAAGLHGDARLRLRRLPQRELRRVDREMAGRGRADPGH